MTDSLSRQDTDAYEWRVVVTYKQHGGIAEGTTISRPCLSRDHALNAYAHYMGGRRVKSVRIERREFVDWQPFNIDAEAARAER